MANHFNQIEGNTDSAAVKHQEPKILNEEMMKPESLKLAQTLIKRGATAEEKLKAAESLAELGYPNLDIRDTDGKVRHLDISTDRGSNGRKIVQVFADDQVALRGVDDNGKFAHQFDDKRNREVAFSGDRFKKAHAESALLGAEGKTSDSSILPSFQLMDIAPLKVELEPHLNGGSSLSGGVEVGRKESEDPSNHAQEINQWLMNLPLKSRLSGTHHSCIDGRTVGALPAFNTRGFLNLKSIGLTKTLGTIESPTQEELSRVSAPDHSFVQVQSIRNFLERNRPAKITRIFNPLN